MLIQSECKKYRVTSISHESCLVNFPHRSEEKPQFCFLRKNIFCSGHLTHCYNIETECRYVVWEWECSKKEIIALDFEFEKIPLSDHFAHWPLSLVDGLLCFFYPCLGCKEHTTVRWALQFNVPCHDGKGMKRMCWAWEILQFSIRPWFLRETLKLAAKYLWAPSSDNFINAGAH